MRGHEGGGGRGRGAKWVVAVKEVVK
jgi:hypothetical protein